MGVAARFLLSALAGLFLSWVVLDHGCELAAHDAKFGAVWTALIWLLPIVWGLLGVLFFDRALAIARMVWNAYFELEG